MKLQEAIEQAKVAFQETFGPEGYAHCRLEGWEDDGVCWIVILSAEFIPPAGTAAHTLSRLTGGRRIYRKVEVNKMNEIAQGILPVPDPYALARVFPRWESAVAAGSVGRARAWLGQARLGPLSAAL